jgi:hypothetical protein
MTELATCAETTIVTQVSAHVASLAIGWVSVAVSLLAAITHVRMGRAEADDAEGLWLLCGAGTKAMGGRGHPLAH